ncbi:uncharacterized protein LOC127709793 [Mytilus californianus]|uniref:uncharacterized protein LOC127709793 n=1 Tax=Mytilus californianus TaxID=6549 RepID=UPI002245BF53|nr:uncharacterized protein LOC127709793 [Mytilus californianus]XP_052071394.1 uncharacterized protein LOC127709793 [Mytilus californianus]XP_052071395.1 uncharacterized protein LOC127709793 [Mytilus californianus]XP_052071396.1 uncharacterized protein LOC127709793 [Mytilus californianus]
MDLRNRKIPTPNFGKGGRNIIITQKENIESGNLIDLGTEEIDNMSISSPSSPMVSPIHTPLHNNYTSVYQENIESSTSLPGTDITAILMDIQRQLKNQNNNFSELSTQVSEMSTQVKLNQENIAQLVRGNHVAKNNANMHDFSQNSCLDFNSTSIEQHNQVLTAPQLAANTSTNNPYTSCPVSTNPIRVSSHVQQLQREEPKPRSPFFNGKGDFKAFWTQFRLLSSRFKWSSDRQVEELILNSLRDDALVFVNELPASLHRDIQQIHDAMSQRFGDHILPETYRTNLQFIKQGQKESIQEYATRVERLVGKAYPEVNDLSLLDRFKTEHFIKGLPDQSVAYEVLIQKPVSLQEAINQVSWLECCRKNVGKKYEVRQVNAGDDVAGQEVTETLQVCRTQDQYVTHSELKSGLDELRKEHQVAIKEVKQGQQEILNVLKSEKKGNGNFNRDSGGYYNKLNGKNSPNDNSFICYSCNQEGHIRRNCPFRGNRDRKWNNRDQSQLAMQNQTNSLNYSGLGLLAKSQPK